MTSQKRRDFLKFMASASLGTALNANADWTKSKSKLPFKPIDPNQKDLVTLAEGFSYKILVKWRDPINLQGERFGFNNDYIAFIPLDNLEGLMWVNHESVDPYFCSGWRPGQPRTKNQIELERKEVGGSIIHVKKISGHYQLIQDSKFGRRFDGFTKIPFTTPVASQAYAIGTLAGCAGGVTPWGTILSCEENYHNFVGDIAYTKDNQRKFIPPEKHLGWIPFAELPPEHYGWVVEVNLKSGASKKLVSLGRFSHECATCVLAKDGRTVVYSGDDAENEHIYKFISARPGSLDEGELFVADTKNGRWLSLDIKKDKRLKERFKNQTDLLIRTREAAKLVGATPLDRPEDIEVDPRSGAVFVSLTMSESNHNPYGSILKLVEQNSNPLALNFSSSTFKAGGLDSGFSCPDNLAFDRKGNLWMTNDISGRSLNKAPFTKFGNNGLFYIPLSGDHAGKVFQVASAPLGAEFTGPCFAPDEETLFLSVQHPGEHFYNGKNPKSSWPNGKSQDPSPAVIQIQGPALSRLLS